MGEAGPTHRMHGPSRSASKRSRSAYPREVRDDVQADRDRTSHDRVPLTAEPQRVDTHLGVDSLPIPGAQLQRLEIEEVHTLGHAVSC